MYNIPISHYWNLGEFDFDLSMSLKVKCDTTYMVFNQYLIVTYDLKYPLQDIRLWNLSDLEFDLSRSVEVKYDDAIGLHMSGFLLILE